MLLYIMFAYVMLLTALFYVVCLCNACLFLFLFALDFCMAIYINAFCFHALSFGY